MKNGSKNAEILMSGMGDMQIRREFCRELKRREPGREFTRGLKIRMPAATAFPNGRKKSGRIVRRSIIRMEGTCRVIASKRKRQGQMKRGAGKLSLLEDKKSRLIAQKENEFSRLEKNLNHLADQKKALESAMQRYTEKGKLQQCERLIGQIDKRMEEKHVKLKSLHFNIMMMRADRYINGYDFVRREPDNGKYIVTHKQFLSLTKTKKLSEKKYKRMVEKEKKAQTLSGRIMNNTKALSGRMIKGSVRESFRAGKEKLSEELEKQGDMGNDALRLIVESPGKVLEGAKTAKDAAGAAVRAPGRLVRGTFHAGKNVYKTGKVAVRGVRVTADMILKARRWAVAFAQSRQKAVILKNAAQQTARAAAAAAKMVARAAVRIILFIIRGILAAGLPVVIIVALILVIAGAVSAITTVVMVPYVDQDTMQVTSELCGDYLSDYIQWTENCRDRFLESDCYTDCDYDHNDTVTIQYMSDGYRTFVDGRALIVYVAAYARFGDISVLGEAPGGMQEAEEIRNFMVGCLEYLNPMEEVLITGTDERFKEYECREEEDSDGNYHHEHEYGEWRLTFLLRTEHELLRYLDFDDEQLELYHSMMSEFSRQVQEETEQEVAMKGFSLTDYFDFFGGSYTSGEVLSELVDLGDIELTEITEFSLRYVGNPYVWGGNSLTNGVDCSGFVKAVYEHFGVTGIPRTSAEQAKTGELVAGLQEARPGDLIFYGQPVHHVALYLGGGQIVHASNSKPYPAGGIKVSSATYSTITCIRRWVNE